MANTEPKSRYYEILAQNAQKGEIYILKLKDDPVMYLTIPMIHPSRDDSGDEFFTYKVLKPDYSQGIYRGFLMDIELLEKK
ncbi:MAG: hypothetical protein R6W71_12280 [Bacteroidales bacterium]